MSEQLVDDAHTDVVVAAAGDVAKPFALTAPADVGAGEPVRPDPQPMNRHAALTYLADLAEGSRRVIEHRLDEIAAVVLPGATHVTFPWHRLEAAHITGIRKLLVDKYKPATARQALSSLRRVLRQCWRLGYYDFDHYKRLADVRPVPGVSVPSGRAISKLEFLKLMEACDPYRPAHVRDRATLALLFGAGARRREAVLLDVAHYDRDARTVLLLGKRAKERVVPLVQWAALSLNDWLAVRGSAPGPMLCEVRPSGSILIHRLSTTAIYQQLAEMISRAGINHLSPKDLRTTFATAIIDQTQDMTTTQRLLGHESIVTTGRYNRTGEIAARKAVDTLGDWFAPPR